MQRASETLESELSEVEAEGGDNDRTATYYSAYSRLPEPTQRNALTHNPRYSTYTNIPTNDAPTAPIDRSIYIDRTHASLPPYMDQTQAPLPPNMDRTAYSALPSRMDRTVYPTLPSQMDRTVYPTLAPPSAATLAPPPSSRAPAPPSTRQLTSQATAMQSGSLGVSVWPTEQTQYPMAPMQGENPVLLSVPGPTESQSQSESQSVESPKMARGGQPGQPQRRGPLATHPPAKGQERKSGKAVKGLAARFCALFLLAVLAALIGYEVLQWYELEHHGWIAWYRHPLSMFKNQLHRVVASKNDADITKYQQTCRYFYKYIGHAKGREKLMVELGEAWWAYQMDQGSLIYDTQRDEPNRRAEIMQTAGTKLVKKLEEGTGSLKEGLDWWVAAGGGGMTLVLLILSWISISCGSEMWGGVGHLGAGLLGILVSSGAGALMSVWLVLASVDVFGTSYMTCPLIYAILFGLIAFLLALDLCLTNYQPPIPTPP